jgi:hypothetical protein
MDISNPILWSSVSVWAMLPLIGTLIVHIAFSAAVYNDAAKLQNENHNLVFVGPILWSLAVLIGGVFAAVGYWLVHHSTMSRL